MADNGITDAANVDTQPVVAPQVPVDDSLSTPVLTTIKEPSSLWTGAFWKGAGERAVKTFAQSLVGFIVVGTTGLIGFDWTTALSIAGAATIASILTSVANTDFVAGSSD